MKNTWIAHRWHDEQDRKHSSGPKTIKNFRYHILVKLQVFVRVQHLTIVIIRMTAQAKCGFHEPFSQPESSFSSDTSKQDHKSLDPIRENPRS